MIRIRKTVAGKGKEPASTSHPDDIFDDAEAERLAAGATEIDSDDDFEDRYDGPITWPKIQEEIREHAWDKIDDINELKKNMKEMTESHNRLNSENAVLRQENSKLKKSVDKLKRFFKELVPTACFSSDDEP